MILSTGYFIYDFLALVYYGLVDKAMVIHHIACIFGIIATIKSDTSANFVVMAFFTTEGSNSFMHARTILRHYGLRYSLTYELFEVLFIVSYLLLRFGIGIPLSYYALKCEHLHLATKFACVGIMTQSATFTKSMIQVLTKRYSEICKR